MGSFRSNKRMDESAKEADKSGLTVPGSYNPHSVHRTVGARPIAISCLGAFSDAADRARGCHCIHRHPKTCTRTDIRNVAEHIGSVRLNAKSAPINEIAPICVALAVSGRGLRVID